VDPRRRQLAYLYARIGVAGGPATEEEAFRLAGFRSEARARAALRSPDVQNFLPILRSPVQEQFVGYTHEALEVLIELMRFAEDEKVRRLAANDVLTYANIKGPDRHEYHITVDDLVARAKFAIRNVEAEVLAVPEHLGYLVTQPQEGEGHDGGDGQDSE